MEEKILMNLLKKSVSPFACVKASMDRLLDNGFQEIKYDEKWKIVPGGKYFLNHHDTTLFAFVVGNNYKAGNMIRMAAAHTDYPCMRIKQNPDFITEGYAQVNLEVYGSPILNTWFDRPLGVAGRVIMKGEKPFSPKKIIYASKKPVMIIPNLAIHMNREVNKGVEINNQTDLMPILDILPDEYKDRDYFVSFIAKELDIEKEDILDFELNTFCMEEPSFVGVNDTLLSAPRLDNQTSVSALLSGVIDAGNSEVDGVRLIALFDHEEIGSSSKQGAASILLHDMTKRILKSLGETEEEIEISIYKSMLLSVDVAHGVHPNNVSKMDITNHPVLGEGFCIKEACAQSYATDSEAIGILCHICEENGINYQRFFNRSDVRGGGTLGSIASTVLPIKTVDIGIPLLSMHSVRELMARKDMDSLKEAVSKFFTA